MLNSNILRRVIEGKRISPRERGRGGGRRTCTRVGLRTSVCMCVIRNRVVRRTFNSKVVTKDLFYNLCQETSSSVKSEDRVILRPTM